jgi:Flp pilus assembly protein TadG
MTHGSKSAQEPAAHSARTASDARSGQTRRGFARRFRDDESGNLTVMSVFMFVGIVGFCGIGVDLMMNEMKRTKLQHTLDRAILAAADLDQELDPEAVVQDYFATSGMSEALSSVTVEEGLNFRTVSATAQIASDPLFMSAVGVDSLSAPAAGTAEERIANVEISMVLDISGSMGWNNKIGNLRNAAREFVDTVIQEDGGGLTTVSIVPYNATVNLGSTLAQYYTLSDEHDYSRCAIFPTSAFTTLGISRSLELERLGHFDPSTRNWSSAHIPNPWCPTSDYGAIMVHEDDAAVLRAHIDSLNAGGNTAIDLGMKWGIALLDPSSQSLVTDMIADGHITPAAENRPAAFDDREAMKILVLMTDGANTTQFDLRPQVKDGMSPIFIDDRGTSGTWDDRFSVLVEDNWGSNNDVYHWVRYRDWGWSSRYQDEPDGGSDARRMSNTEVFARWGVVPVWEQFFARPYSDGQLTWNEVWPYGYGYTSIVDANSADSRLSTICDEARDQGVTVYAISFEAPQRGIDAMSDCASSPSHFFDVDGVEITDAFSAIARTINQLRLTQ